METKLELTQEAIEEAWAQILGFGDIIEDGPTIHTTAELVEMTGKCASTVRARMRDAIKAGQVERVKVRRMTSDGKAQPVPAYRLLVDNGKLT